MAYRFQHLTRGERRPSVAAGAPDVDSQEGPRGLLLAALGLALFAQLCLLALEPRLALDPASSAAPAAQALTRWAAGISAAGFEATDAFDLMRIAGLSALVLVVVLEARRRHVAPANALALGALLACAPALWIEVPMPAVVATAALGLAGYWSSAGRARERAAEQGTEDTSASGTALASAGAAVGLGIALALVPALAASLPWFLLRGMGTSGLGRTIARRGALALAAAGLALGLTWAAGVHPAEALTSLRASVAAGGSGAEALELGREFLSVAPGLLLLAGVLLGVLLLGEAWSLVEPLLLVLPLALLPLAIAEEGQLLPLAFSLGLLSVPGLAFVGTLPSAGRALHGVALLALVVQAVEVRRLGALERAEVVGGRVVRAAERADGMRSDGASSDGARSDGGSGGAPNAGRGGAAGAPSGVEFGAPGLPLAAARLEALVVTLPGEELPGLEARTFPLRAGWERRGPDLGAEDAAGRLRLLLARARGDATGLWFSDGAVLSLAQSSGIDVGAWVDAPPVELWTAGEGVRVRLVRARADLFDGLSDALDR